MQSDNHYDDDGSFDLRVRCVLSTGSHYDKEGQARQWWTPADMVNYQEQTECMVDHYSCFRWKPARMNVGGDEGGGGRGKVLFKATKRQTNKTRPK